MSVIERVELGVGLGLVALEATVVGPIFNIDAVEPRRSPLSLIYEAVREIHERRDSSHVLARKGKANVISQHKFFKDPGLNLSWQGRDAVELWCDEADLAFDDLPLECSVKYLKVSHEWLIYLVR